MLQCEEENDEFVTINLEADSCDLCYRDNGQEVTHCKICQSLLTDGPVRFGFNDMRGVIHTNKLGHDLCFKEDHYQLLEWSIKEESQPSRTNLVSPHRLKTPPRHIHASSLPKPTHLSVEWMNNIQNNAKSHSNPSTRSSSPIHTGRRASTAYSDHQHLELRKSCAKYLFGENSPEFEQYSNQTVPFINCKEDHFSAGDGNHEKSTLSIDLKNIPQLIKSGGLLNLPVVPCDTNNTAWEKRNCKGSPLSRFQANISFYGGRKISGDKTCNQLTQTEESFQPPAMLQKKQMTMSPYTKKELQNLGLDLLREIMDSLQHIVTETSTNLVALLEERDNLKHENDTRHVTIQKLVQLQTEKINSSPSMPRKK